MTVKSKELSKREVSEFVKEDGRRLKRLFKRYNPLTGENAPGKRAVVVIGDYLDGRTLYIPPEAFADKFLCALVRCRTIQGYIAKYLPDFTYDECIETILRHLEWVRCKYDFYYFAYSRARIKNKDGGPDIPFYLRPAQRKLVKTFEKMRLEGSPIRVILLKCRQWGGSTATDIYMGWIQVFWKTSWNSNIVGHQSTSATQVFDMYEKLIDSIPTWLFYEPGEAYDEVDKKLKGSSTTSNIKYMVPRKCKIQTGSALAPESTRSGDAAMAHITEEAFFPSTTKFTPSQVVKSALSGINPKPYTFIVRESTPNGRENEFHDEWVRANTFDKDGKRMSSFIPVFVAWHEIEEYVIPFESESERADFAIWLWRNRNDEAGNGKYYWWLWEICHASLEGIHWYVTKAKDYDSLDDMKQEYPSDDIEAFLYSGIVCFDPYKIKEMESDCEDASFVGDIEGASFVSTDAECVEELHLVANPGGSFKIWEMPDKSEDVDNRYLVSVDIGGSYRTSDYYSIVVFDRYDEMFGGVPAVVAEYHGHLDADQAAMKCAQIAIFYNNAFLVVENNTAYSKMNKTDGDISQLFFPILIPLYDNLFNSNHNRLLKRQPKEVMWGFNTNRSTKTAICKNLMHIVRDHGYVEREKETLNEYSYFMFYEKNGTYGAVAGKHDDRVMARAIGLHVDKEMDPPVIVPRLTEEQKEAQKALRRRPMTVGTGIV